MSSGSWVLDSKVPDLQVAFVVELSDDLNRCVHLLDAVGVNFSSSGKNPAAFEVV